METRFVGEGRPLDPSRYFIILPGQFGNGFSSSPSNTPLPDDRGAFPHVTIGDDVRAQHRLVTEQFGINELQLVLGWSMGAEQTYEWAVRYPGTTASTTTAEMSNSGCAGTPRCGR
jgi:homoserine O-acetyltransferase/O-succinyltransferase